MTDFTTRNSDGRTNVPPTPPPEAEETPRFFGSVGQGNRGTTPVLDLTRSGDFTYWTQHKAEFAAAAAAGELTNHPTTGPLGL